MERENESVEKRWRRKRRKRGEREEKEKIMPARHAGGDSFRGVFSVDMKQGAARAKSAFPRFATLIINHS